MAQSSFWQMAWGLKHNNVLLLIAANGKSGENK